MTEGRLLGLRLLIEGIEVDVASAAASGGEGTSAQAAIVIPVSDILHQLRPRSLVHLYSFDSSYVVNPNMSMSSPLVDDPGARDMRNWRLVFTGEVSAYSYQSSGGRRHMTLYCGDFTSYWEMAKIYWGDASNPHAVPFKRARVMGAAQLDVNGKPSKKAEDILSLLMAEPKSLKGATGILGGVISLLEATTGVYTQPKGGSKEFAPGINSVLGQAEVRLHITRTIAASALDNTSAKFIDVAQYKQYFKRLSTSMQHTASYMQLVTMFLQRVYYQWSSIVAPPFLADGTKVETEKLDRKVSVKLKSVSTADPAVNALFATAKRVYDFLSDYQTNAEANKRSFAGTDIIGFNAVVPTAEEEANATMSSINKYEPDEDGWTRVKVETAATGYQAYSSATINGIITGFTATAKASGSADALNAAMNHVAPACQSVDLAFSLLRKYTTQRSEFSLDTTIAIRYALERAHEEMGKATAPTSTTKTLKGGTGEVEMAARLHMILMSPDLFMCPPPKCNVLFPDDYSSIQFGRSWNSEITRLVMHGRSKHGQETKDIYFAPYAELLTTNNLAAESKGGISEQVDKMIAEGAMFIMRHEKFVGIVADIQVLGDNDIFKQIFTESEKTRDKAERRTGEQSHLKRAALYLFFSRRFESRTISVRARYVPKLISGLPCLILCPRRDSAPNLVGTIQAKYGTHFVGVVQKVSHSFDASGGVGTMVSLYKCRTHDEAPELFGGDTWDEVDKRYVKKTRKLRPPTGYEFQMQYAGADENGFAIIDDMIKEDAQYNVLNLRPVKGRTYEIRTKDYSAISMAAGLTGFDELGFADPEISGDPTGTGIFNAAPDGHVVVNPTVANGELSAAAASGMVTADPAAVPLIPVEITETSVSALYNKSKASFESSTPPWFDPIFGPGLIGPKFYSPLLGCDSVLDATEVQAADNADLFAADSIYAAIGQSSGTVFQAAEALALAWLNITEAGGNVSMFIEGYCHRSYASMQDIMGTLNPHLEQRLQNGGLPTAAPDIPGFHGNAYGNYANMKDVNGEDMVPPGSVDVNVDPRAARYKVVREYVDNVAGTAGRVVNKPS